MSRFVKTSALALALLAGACGGDTKKACDPAAQTGCSGGQVCEAVQSGTPACFTPVIVRGQVSDPTTSPVTYLDDARVVALDANRAPLSTVAVSASNATDGGYELKVRAARDASGKPMQAYVTLRADRQDYQTFPGGVRVALPVDLSAATFDGTQWVVSGPLTAVQLLPLATRGASWIHGTAAAAPSGEGILVVAEPAPGGAGPGTGLTGIADEAGNYAIFNLAPGAQYVVTAYAKGVNYLPVPTPALVPGDNAVPALALGSGAGATLAGGLIFNNSATSNVQVTLVEQSTYLPSLDRGETPPGLTVNGDASGYTFTGVPDGKYVVLAAFGLDGDVRSVSGTGNTAPPEVTIAGGAVQGTPPSFKIVPAVDLLTIGGANVTATPAVVSTATPAFTWRKGSVDSSAATYRVEVFDTFGNPAWSLDMPATQTDSATYDSDGRATPLQPGMTYQLRILAIKEAMPVPAAFTQLSQTEDLAGVFTYQP